MSTYTPDPTSGNRSLSFSLGQCIATMDREGLKYGKYRLELSQRNLGLLKGASREHLQRITVRVRACMARAMEARTKAQFRKELHDAQIAIKELKP